jgi:adenylate cyclase
MVNMPLPLRTEQMRSFVKRMVARKPRNEGPRWLKPLHTRTGRAVLVAAIALTGVIALNAVEPWFVGEIRTRTFDVYQRLQPRAYGDFPVRVVAIDDASLAAIGQWPWPRTRLAGLVQRLSELGAGAIVFDAVFSEPDRTSPARVAAGIDPGNSAETKNVLEQMARLPDHDQIFADAIRQAPVVLGFAVEAGRNDRRPSVKAGFAYAGVNPLHVLPVFFASSSALPVLDQAASGIGGINVSPSDTSGVVRRMPMLFSDGTKTYPSLVAEALRAAQNQKSIFVRGTGASGDMDTGKPALLGLRVGDLKVPVTSQGELLLYYDHDRPDRYVSVSDVLDRSKESVVRPKLDGHIVFIGWTAGGLTDFWPTSLGEWVPGVSIHAQAAEQIIGDVFLSRPDWAKGLEIITTLVLGALLTFLLLRFGAQYAFAIGALFVVGVIGLSWMAFSRLGMLLDPIYPSIGAGSVYLAVVAVLYVATDKEKKFVRQAFGQYLAPELLHRLERAPHLLRLGGETRPVSILFMDVRDFTTISESLTAPELVEFINRLLSPLSDAIQSELGTIDKYVGDQIMAFWNAPLDIADHPARACRAALKMRAIAQQLNADDAFGFQARGFAKPEVRIGVGINTGAACVGNMGSERRFNYSALGDSVNTASRIESSCKTTGFDLLVSQDTARAVPDFAMLEAGEISLKGKSRPAKLFALIGDEQTAASDEFKNLARHHARLIETVASGDAGAALAALAACRLLGGALLTSFYDRFEKKIAESPPTHAKHVTAAAM